MMDFFLFSTLFSLFDKCSEGKCLRAILLVDSFTVRESMECTAQLLYKETRH